MEQPTSKAEEISCASDGRLHMAHYVIDEQGHKIAAVTGPLKVEFRIQDLAQLVAGACVMAMPISLAEEVWNLGTTLSLGIHV
jgi:uncharacterized membrane protein